MASTWETSKELMKIVSPLTWLIMEGAEKSSNLIAKASDQGLEKLTEEVAKQNLKMQFEQQQARIAQEVAIANRIANAQEVEIEEFYDASGKGHLGLTADVNAGTGAIGLGGEGRKVTKRVYHFNGWRESEMQVITQEMNDKQPGPSIKPRKKTK